mgnify:CR=1 FL=1
MFYIKESEGVKFAKLSGDNNVVHFDKIAGNNSIYGYKIVHGVLVILKFLREIKLTKNYTCIKVQFQKGFEYNCEIRIRKIKKNNSEIIYQLIQNNNISANIKIVLFPKRYLIQNLQKITFKKKYSISNKMKKKFANNHVSKELRIALCYLSKYVGAVYPGKHSLLKEINIFNNNLNQTNKIYINSFLLSKVCPLIDNRLIYKNYHIEFKTLIRPELNIKLNKPNKNILKEINLIKENILIIGASSGIGNDLLKLFLNNKKIKIIGTYYKNKIRENKKNLIVKKLNIENDLKIIYGIIKKFDPIIIYYFPTPKIYFKSIEDINIINKYKKYFIHIPIDIIKFSNNFKSKFFYPSTTYNNALSPYSSIKLKAEKEINKLNKLKTEINVLKIPSINTKQNLSLLSEKLPNFRYLMMKKKEVLNKVLFKN